MISSAQKNSAIAVAHNALLAAGLIGLQLFQLFVIPLVLLPYSSLWGLLLLPLILAGNSMWSLIHEGIHRLCHPSAKINDRLSRLLSVLFGVSFDVVKFGHTMHHRYNRDWESEFYDPRQTPRWQAALLYYAKIFGGYYVIEIVTSLLFLLPTSLLKKLFHYHAQTAMAHLSDVEAISNNYFFVRGRARIVRIDTLLVMLIYGASAWAYGAHWPWLALMLAGRAFTVSFMDNIYHYATPADNSLPAKEIVMPRWLEVITLSGNHHHSHHRQSNVAWDGLPTLHKKIGTDYHQTFWQAARDQFKGPLIKNAAVS